MLNYKKPAFWIIVVAVIACIALSVGFLTNPTTKLDTNMASFIEEQIIEHHHGGYKSGEFYCTDFKVLGTEKDKENTTVYMWVLYSEYDKINGKIEDVSGAHIPTVITVKKLDSTQYELVEYWEPRDGSYYAEDIKDKFPWYLHGKALDSQRYIKEQQENCNKKAQAYFSSISNVGGVDDPTNVIVSTTIDELKDKYPQFFNVSTDGGLTVYIWQMSKNNYQCYLVNRGIDMLSDQSFAFEVGATIAEMRAILTTYNIDKEDITIHPVRNPLSSYYYEIDDAYQKNVEELFWSESSSTVEIASTIETEISKAILNQYRNEKPDGLICVESHYTLLTASSTPLVNQDTQQIIVYLQMLYEKYSVSNGNPKKVSSSFSPVAITFEVDKDGNYTVVEFWEAEPGENYERSIKEKFPQQAITKISALNSSEELETKNLEKVKEQLK